MRRVSFALASIALAVLACLLLGEVVMRLALDRPRYHRGPIELDEELGFRGVPLSKHEARDDAGDFLVELNRSGLRGREIPAQPPTPDARIQRIAFVGDSFLVAEAVRDGELVSTLTERALDTPSRSAEVYNLAGVDYGTAQQLLLLRSVGQRIRPSRVVLFFYSGNDVINNSLELAGVSTVSAGDYIRPYLVPDGETLRRSYAHPIRAWLRHHSRVFAEFERSTLGLSVRGQLPWLAPWPPVLGPTERLRAGLSIREDLEVLRPHHPGHRWERAWKTTEALLKAFRRECEQLGARLLVVVVPNVHQVERSAKGVRLEVGSRFIARRGLDSGLKWNFPEQRLSAFFATNGFEAHLLLPDLRRAAGTVGSVFGRDEHLNPAGHAVAAEALTGWLRSEAAIPFTTSPIRGTPVAVLPDARSTPPRLDFRRHSHSGNLGDGWLRWDPKADSASAYGWEPGAAALLVLPAARGDLLLRGQVPEGVPVPVVGAVQILGALRHPFAIDRSGLFEIRIPTSGRRQPFEVSRDGYIPVELQLGGPRAGLRIHEVGFEAAPDDATAPSR